MKVTNHWKKNELRSSGNGGKGGACVGLRHRIHSVHGGRAVVLGESEETTLGVSRGPEGGGVGGRPAVSSVCIDRAAGG